MKVARPPFTLYPVFLASMLVLAACSGESSDDDENEPDAPSERSLTGTAASGAGFANATVRVYDRTGAEVGASSAVGSDGKWSTTLANTAQAPFVLVANRVSGAGEDQTLVGVLAEASAPTTNVNVTSLTTVIAARLSPSGNPTNLVEELKSGAAKVDALSLAARAAELKELLAPMLTATGTTDFDPLQGAFTADTTGHDRLLDSLAISVTPSSLTSTTIEIGLKLSGSAQPPEIQFESSASLAEIKAANSVVISEQIDPASLVPMGTAALIQNMLGRLNECYALSLQARVNMGGATAADVVAPVCRGLFINDDPGEYLNNGSVVSRTGSFTGLFADGATGTRFDQGAYEFSRANGDLLVSYRTVLPTGTQSLQTVVFRNQFGQLKAVGNQYTYGGGVNAYHQHRQFLTLNQSAYNYWSTAYNVSVPNTTKNGTPIFDRVEVSTPTGALLTLKPSVGSDTLNLVRMDGTTSGTTLFRLNAAFDEASTGGTPANKDVSLVFAVPQLTDEAVAGMAVQSLWTFKYYLASDPGAVAATQTYRTRARAMTIAELRTKPMARLAAASQDDLVTKATETGRLSITAGGPFGPVTWDVPQGALPPTNVAVFGVHLNGPTQTFNDLINVAPSVRSTSVPCATATAADAHCAGSGPAYVEGNVAVGLHLVSTDSLGRTFGVHYASYRLP